MKNRFYCLLFIFMIVNSSCFMLARQQSMDKRFKKHAKEIVETDTTKIHFDGVYLTKYDVWQYNDRVNYVCYRFFRGGKFLVSEPFYDNEPSKKQMTDMSDSCVHLYFIKDNYLYTEAFSPVDGYYLNRAHFMDNYRQIVFEDLQAIKTKSPPNRNLTPVFKFIPF